MIRLEQIRRELDMSPEQIGGLAGLSGVTIRRIEAGRPTTTTTLNKLAAVLKVDRPFELLEEVES